MFAFSLHLSLTVTSITFPVIFESIMDWSTNKKTFCAESCDVSFHLGLKGSGEDEEVPRGVSRTLSPASKADGSWTGLGEGLVPRNSHPLSFAAKGNAASGRTLM